MNKRKRSAGDADICQLEAGRHTGKAQQQLCTPDSEAETRRKRAKSALDDASSTSATTFDPALLRRRPASPTPHQCYDPDFGAKVCRRYAISETSARVTRAYRIAQYGQHVADCFAPGRTPEEAREAYARRLEDAYPSSSESESEHEGTDSGSRKMGAHSGKGKRSVTSGRSASRKELSETYVDWDKRRVRDRDEQGMKGDNGMRKRLSMEQDASRKEAAPLLQEDLEVA